MSALTIGSVFRNAARAVPHRAAAALGGRQLTFAEIDVRADQIARALSARGITRGDRVLCWTDTSLDVVPLFAALARMGAVYCPVPANLGARESLHLMRLARPALLIVEAAGASGRQFHTDEFPVLDMPALSAAADEQPAQPFPDAAEESDTHVLFFTSGSTGRPKGVMLSHRVNYLRSHPGSQEEPRGAMVCAYPLFHMGAWTISLQQWQARDLVVYVAKPDGRTIVDAVRTHSASRLNGIPAVWQRVLDTLEAEPEGLLPSIRFADSGTSATPLSLLEAIASACPNACLRVFYGSTEAGNVASLAGPDVLAKPGSCGVPSQATEVRIDAGTGELCVRGPLLFDGYFGDADATTTAIRDGWLHTGDVATVDPDGYLSIAGRLSDIIRTGGEAVAPAEVEAALAGLPGVSEVAVVGVPDPRWGELVCAVLVVAGDGPAPTLDGIREWCTGRIAAFKHPRALHTMPALPRTPATGQVQRRLIVTAIQSPEEDA